jgi:uncharacterized protein with HEPN domain
MLPDERDAAFLWDMLESARDAREYAATVSLEQLRADKYARYTIAKPLEMVGEAAARLSPGFRAAP